MFLSILKLRKTNTEPDAKKRKIAQMKGQQFRATSVAQYIEVGARTEGHRNNCTEVYLPEKS